MLPVGIHSNHLVPLLLLQTTSVLSDPLIHVYPPNCAPPIGGTTPAPGNDTDIIDPGYISMLPIEYCCPQVNECKKQGGFCGLHWLLKLLPYCCDFKLEGVCKDYGCSCCIKCNEDKCNKCTEHYGNCRVKCHADETRDYFKKCSFDKCHCCKKCTSTQECTDAYGACFANPYDCPPGTAASSGCCGGCYCCKPELQKLLPCERKVGSYCSASEECATGYYPWFGKCEATHFINGLKKLVAGYCCVPKVPIGQVHPARMGAFDHYMEKVSADPLSGDQLIEEDIESSELDDLSPRPQGGNAQDNVENMVEDQILEEGVPVDISSLEDNEEVDADIEIQNVENINSPKIASPIQEDSDTGAAMVLDSPSDISDQIFNADQEVDKSNNEAEEPKRHRKNHRKHAENKN